MSSVSIITAVRNGAATIIDTMSSLVSQTHPAEHIIIDGGSTDNTLDIVRKISPSARIISEPDTGIYDAMNKGIRLATGDIVGILNADDFYADAGVLAKVAAVFANPTVEACYGDLEYVSANRDSGFGIRDSGLSTQDLKLMTQDFKVTRYWRSGSFDAEKFYWGWMPPHPTFFVQRSVYEKYGFFRLDMGSAADYELMLRFLFKHRITASYLPEVLVKMRSGGVSNATLANRLRANRMDRLAWSVNGLTPYPWTLLLKPLRKLPQYRFPMIMKP
jgi:glycosyltransferase involved in cell wall biosynthesis